MNDWYEMALKTEDVFGVPRIAPQGQDGTPHFNYYDRERQLSFQWNGNLKQHVVVSHGGYGEPIKWTFDFSKMWKLPSGVGVQTPTCSRGDEMFGAAYHFGRACKNWIERMEARDILDDLQENQKQTPIVRFFTHSANALVENSRGPMEIFFENRSDAVDVIEAVNWLMKQHDMVTVAKLYDLVDVPADLEDSKWGWTEPFRESMINRAGVAWKIGLPLAKPIS